MNKILNINLGGYALTIDDDAYEYLQAYLESIRNRFRESDGRDEILGDIETRLGELISQGMGNRSIVMLPDAEAAVQVMGRPEEFGGDPEGSTATSTNSSQTNRGTGTPPPLIRTGKRLFRDPEDAPISGVCSGLAAYFGIQEPIWMRLIFVLLAIITGGSWIIVYFLMWALIAPAVTAADRLAMRGEQANAENIAREIEDGVHRFGKNVGIFGREIGQKSRSTGGSCLIALLKIPVVFAIVILAIMLISILIGWVSGIVGLVSAAPLIPYFSPFSSGMTWLAFFNVFFLVSLPVIGLILLCSHLLFKTSTPKWLSSSLGLWWGINLIASFFFIGFGVSSYGQSNTITQEIDLSSVPTDTLRVEASVLTPYTNTNVNFGFDNDDDNNPHVTENGLDINGMVEIYVRRSTSNHFECTQAITARGSDYNEAAENAANTNFKITPEGTILRIPTGYTVPPGGKWRVQIVKIYLGVPVGKAITFGKQINNRVRSGNYDHNQGYIFDTPNRVFIMTEDGLRCKDCPQIGDRNYRSDRDYENFILEGNFTTEIRESNEFSVQIEGATNAREQIQIIRRDNKITFTTDGKTVSPNLKVIITAPTFTSLKAEDTGDITIRGFDEGRATISVVGTSKVKASFDVDNLDITLSGQCSLNLMGESNDLEINLNDGAVLEGGNWRTDRVTIDASNNSKARVYAKDNARIRKDGTSEVKVDGGARVDDDDNDNNH